MLQRSHPHPRGRRSVPSGHGVGGRGAGHQAPVRRPAGLEDLGQGGGTVAPKPANLAVSHG